MSPLEKMAKRLLRAELAARGAIDVDAAEAAIAPMLCLDPNTGEYFASPHSSVPLISSTRPGCPMMDLSEVLAVEIRRRPELFGGQSVDPGRIGQPPASNPFLPGPNYNITTAMQIYKNDPELATKLAADAGMNLEVKR